MSPKRAGEPVHRRFRNVRNPYSSLFSIASSFLFFLHTPPPILSLKTLFLLFEFLHLAANLPRLHLAYRISLPLPTVPGVS